VLEYDYAPDEAQRLAVRRAAAACPVQAISIGSLPESPAGKGGQPPAGGKS
jgi:hypothetical protein